VRLSILLRNEHENGLGQDFNQKGSASVCFFFFFFLWFILPALALGARPSVNVAYAQFHSLPASVRIVMCINNAYEEAKRGRVCRICGPNARFVI